MNRPPAGGRFAAPLLAGALRAVGATWRVHIHGRELLDEALAGGAVVGFWHGQILPMVVLHRNLGLVGVVSHSPDGELAARVITRMGYGVLRGSSSRGGAKALRAGLDCLRGGASPALAVDGPRGPRHEPGLGAVAMAAHSGRPVLFGVSVATPAVRLSSWDRLEIPLAFAKVEVAYGLLPPGGTDRQAIEAARVELRGAMEALEEQLVRRALTRPVTTPNAQ